ARGMCCLTFSNFGFDASLWAVLLALTRGGPLCIVPQEARSSGDALVRLLRDLSIEIATFPASVLASLPAGAERDLPALRTIVSTAEACTPEILARFAPGRRFCHRYG